MDQRDFELLLTLEETRNITRASDLLFISQSALSKRIQSIEKELNVSLLIRSRQGIHFTPEGEIVLNYAKEATRLMERLGDSLNQAKAYICGTLKVGMSFNYALYKLPDVLADYQHNYPHVSTYLHTVQSAILHQQLVDGELDVGIIRGEFDWKGPRILLERENVYAIFHPDDGGKSMHELPFVGRRTDYEFEKQLAQWMMENNIQRQNTGIFADNITTCVQMVERGIGWSVVPEICLGEFKGIKIPLYFADGEPFVRSTYLMYNESSLALPQVEAFINQLKGIGGKKHV